MNVWIVNPFDNLPMEGHRPQRYWMMARAFVRAGHSVTYWTSDFSHATKQKRKGAVGFEAPPQGASANTPYPFARTSQTSCASKNIAVIQIPTIPYKTNVCWARVRSHRQLARDFEKVVGDSCRAEGKPDLVIASTPPLGLCAAAMRVARKHGAKFVCDIQDAWPETFRRLLPRGLKWMGGILLAPMYRTARTVYREADFVTGVCARYAELTGRRDFYLAYLGIEDRGEGSREKGAGKEFSRLVYVGNLGVGYDLSTVLRAMKRRDDLTLDIAGSGPMEAPLKREAASLGLTDRVRFHGYLGEAALRELMARGDVGVIPMRDDSWVGLPNKLTDYLAAGLPVVSSLHGECGALLARTGFGTTYERGNEESLLVALRSLRRDVIVSLPEELRAERIYPDYVQAVI